MITPVFHSDTAKGGVRVAPRRARFAVVATLMAAALAAAGANQALARAAPESFADLAEKLSPSVVNVSTTQKVETSNRGVPEFRFPPGSPFEEFFKEFFDRNRPKREGPARRRVTSLGSGFVIDSSGLIVTNNHVIADADEIAVRLADGRKFDAEVIGKDPKTDLALLKIKKEVNLPALKWGDSSKHRVGDWVLAIGNPFGLGGTVTAGIISARKRDINAGPYDDFIQTDASINRGNSGGPLFNMAGEVIGINTAIFSPSGGSVGIGFAIPSTLARNVIEQLRDHGRTRRGWLGVSIQTVTDGIASTLGLDEARGALVAAVSEGSPAEKAGVKQGDVILEFNGRKVDAMRTLPRIVAETKIGSKVAVKLWRRSETLEMDVVIGELEEAEKKLASVGGDNKDKPSSVDALGMTLATITDELRKMYELDKEAAGVIVTKVTSDGAAAEKGIRPGDVIMEVSQQEVGTPQDVSREIDNVRSANPKRRTVLLLLSRAGRTRYVAVRLEES